MNPYRGINPIGKKTLTNAELAAILLPYLLISDIDDVPVDGEFTAPISSNWAFDHLAAADPHPQYLTVTEGDALFLTPAEGNALYSVLGHIHDHGTLTGLADNDHPQYLLIASYTAADVLAKILTVDGSGSLLDADLLDGLNSANFSRTTVAGPGNNFISLDSRATDFLPQDRNAGLYADFKENTTDGLADGGSYHGVLTFRKYGSDVDLTGGPVAQIAYTDAGNLHIRLSTGATTWGTWIKFWNSNNGGAGSGLDADLLDGLSSTAFSLVGHTHLLISGATDVTITAANLNSLDDGVNSALHFHDVDRARANHTGTQLAATISDFSEASQDVIGTLLADSATIDFVYDDGGNTLTANVKDGAVDLSNIIDGVTSEVAVNKSRVYASPLVITATGILKIPNTSQVAIVG